MWHPLIYILLKLSTITMQRLSLKDRQLIDITICTGEALDLEELQELNSYYALRTSVRNIRPQRTFVHLQEYVSITSVNHTERSNVANLKVMDAVPDIKDTIITVLHNLQQKFIIERGIENVVVEGAANLFNILLSLKHKYGEELYWLIPFPGGWHAVKNYQAVLLKPYTVAGLGDMDAAA